MKALALVGCLLLMCPLWMSGQQKWNGVNLVGEQEVCDTSCLLPLQRISANTIALNPFAYGSKYVPRLEFDTDWQWWGETTTGTIAWIEMAKSKGYRVVIKPHLWIMEDGWAGELSFANDQEWEIWEKDYRHFILTYARIADSMDVDMLCIGTELRKSVTQRTAFWHALIKEVRDIYTGPLTYAANWDNYEHVTFWSELDYIGIDAYFPLDSARIPDVDKLMSALAVRKLEIQKVQAQYDRPVLFTEYGYRSIENCCAEQWLLPEHHSSSSLLVSLRNQVESYRALFQTFWPEPWMAGGFLWKWHPSEAGAGAEDGSYSPQGKPTETVIRGWYKAFD